MLDVIYLFGKQAFRVCAFDNCGHNFERPFVTVRLFIVGPNCLAHIHKHIHTLRCSHKIFLLFVHVHSR